MAITAYVAAIASAGNRVDRNFEAFDHVKDSLQKHPAARRRRRQHGTTRSTKSSRTKRNTTWRSASCRPNSGCCGPPSRERVRNRVRRLGINHAFSSFDISTSALVAQRTRLNAISSNIANMSTTRNEQGEPEPYQPRYVTFQTDTDVTSSGGGSGVKVGSVEYSNEPPRMKYEPGHPDADAQGYVHYPAVDMTDGICRRAGSVAGLRSQRRRDRSLEGPVAKHAENHCLV